MMKILYVFLFALICSLGSATNQYQCTSSWTNIVENEMKDSKMEKECAKKLTEQIGKEIDASLTYLQMAAHFARDSQNRPGFSKFFFENANEEREHAIKIIEYLLMRGQLVGNIKDILKFPLIKNHKEENWATGLNALNYAFRVELEVTRNIKKIISQCESPVNDYHLVDYLSGEFLEEQYKSEHDLATKISTLSKMSENNPLAEFLFDKKLLNGEV